MQRFSGGPACNPKPGLKVKIKRTVAGTVKAMAAGREPAAVAMAGEMGAQVKVGATAAIGARTRGVVQSAVGAKARPPIRARLNPLEA
jgi:hypothetical protein